MKIVQAQLNTILTRAEVGVYMLQTRNILENTNTKTPKLMGCDLIVISLFSLSFDDPQHTRSRKVLIKPWCSSPCKKIAFVVNFFKRFALVTGGGDNCLYLLNDNSQAPQKNGTITERAIIYIFQAIFRLFSSAPYLPSLFI